MSIVLAERRRLTDVLALFSGASKMLIDLVEPSGIEPLTS